MVEIAGFEGKYNVTEDGRIISVFRHVQDTFLGKPRIRHYPEKEISQQLTKFGYKKCNLWKENKMYTIQAHRLVAIAYIPNPEDKPEVNHKDGDKTNNHVSNLEWCTRSENSIHSIEVLKRWPHLRSA